MAKDKGEDQLQEAVEGLGTNRLRPSESDQQSDEADGEGSQEAESADPESTEQQSGEASGVEWTRTTLYLQEDTKRDLDHYLKRLSLDHRAVDEAQKRELHEALVQVALTHTEEFLDEVEDIGS